jgi:hypothetical protein
VGLIDYLDRRLGSHFGDGPEYQYFCPFCIDRLGDESNQRKLWVNEVKGKVVCYRCGFGAKSLETMFRAMNSGVLRFEELKIVSGARTPPTTNVLTALIELFYSVDDAEAEPLPVQLPAECIGLSARLEERPIHLRGGINYLNDRGVSARQIEVFKLGYCATGDYAGYIIFPVYQGGKLVYFTSRLAGDVGEFQTKSKNPKNRDGYHAKKTCLLNFDSAVGAPVVALVEGGFDMMAHEAAVGLMGKTISEEQIKLIELLVEKGTKELVVSLDADVGRQAERIFRALQSRVPKVTMLLLDHGDPYDRRAELPALMAERTTELSMQARLCMRLSRDPKKRRTKGIDKKGRMRHTRSRNQRGSRN